MLTDYPAWPSQAMRVDPSLLDELAETYAGEDVARFLFGFVPIEAFDRILGEADGAIPAESFVWLMHLSGYFGGVWLRAEIRRAQPESPLAGAGQAPTRAGFDAIALRAQAALDAARGAPLDAVEKSLPELFSSFGYNQGYLLEIVESPPEGLAPPTGFVVPRAPLWCDYATPRLRSLPRLREVARRLADPPDPRWRALASELGERVAPEVERGRAVWSSGLSVQGFSAEAYAQLLDVSGSFLEVLQAVTLTAVRAVAERDATLARRAALARACLAPWLGSYLLGLMDPRNDDARRPPLPSFAPATGACTSRRSR